MSITTVKVKYQSRFTWLNGLCAGYLALLVFFAFFADYLPFSYEPNDQDLLHIYQKPFQWGLYRPGEPFHWLGTDDLGRDVGVNLVYGTRTALLVSVPAIILAATIGITLGLLAGYYGDTGLRQSVSKLLALVLTGLFLIFYLFEANYSALVPTGSLYNILVKGAVVLVSIIIYKVLSYWLLQTWLFRKRVRLPLDLAVLKLIELIGTVPRLLLILCLAAFSPNDSLTNLIFLFVVTFWTGIARLTRAEVLKIKNLPYLEAAVALGYHPVRVIMRHALPNMLVPLLVAITFGICNLIALEATLSFLGIGIPNDMASWGRSVNKIRENFQAWWLVLFPGLAILGTVLSLQNLNTFIINKLNPQQG